jgi:hypothetical protein
MARVEATHRCGIGSSTQRDQQAQGQSGTHPSHSESNKAYHLRTIGHDPKL